MNKIKWSIKQLALLLSILLIATFTVGGTLAYITTHTEGLVNTFKPTSVNTDLEETFDGAIKSDVFVKNTGDVSAYIRAAVVITWQDGTNVHPDKPVKDTHYTITYTTDTNWVKHTDGYWYYKLPIAKDGYTTDLIEECKWIAAGPDGYNLNVEIMTEAVQSSPSSAVTNAWNVDPSKLTR